MLFVIYYRVALVRIDRRRRKTKVPFFDIERLEEAVARIRTVNSLRAADARSSSVTFVFFALLKFDPMVPIVPFDAGGTICSA